MRALRPTFTRHTAIDVHVTPLRAAFTASGVASSVLLFADPRGSGWTIVRVVLAALLMISSLALIYERRRR